MQVGKELQAAEELLLAQTVRYNSYRMEFSSSRGTIAAPNVNRIIYKKKENKSTAIYDLTLYPHKNIFKNIHNFEIIIKKNNCQITSVRKVINDRPPAGEKKKIESHTGWCKKEQREHYRCLKGSGLLF